MPLYSVDVDFRVTLLLRARNAEEAKAHAESTQADVRTVFAVLETRVTCLRDAIVVRELVVRD